MWYSVPSNSTFRADLPQAHSTSALEASSAKTDRVPMTVLPH